MSNIPQNMNAYFRDNTYIEATNHAIYICLSENTFLLDKHELETVAWFHSRILQAKKCDCCYENQQKMFK